MWEFWYEISNIFQNPQKLFFHPANRTSYPRTPKSGIQVGNGVKINMSFDFSVELMTKVEIK